MELPNWLLSYLVGVVIVHVAAWALCQDDLTGTPTDTSGNTFDALQNIGTFQDCGFDAWFQWSLFTIFTFPVLLLLAIFLFQAFNNDVTGTILGVGVILGGLAALFL